MATDYEAGFTLCLFPDNDALWKGRMCRNYPPITFPLSLYTDMFHYICKLRRVINCIR